MKYLVNRKLTCILQIDSFRIKHWLCMFASRCWIIPLCEKQTIIYCICFLHRCISNLFVFVFSIKPKDQMLYSHVNMGQMSVTVTKFMHVPSNIFKWVLVNNSNLHAYLISTQFIFQNVFHLILGEFISKHKNARITHIGLRCMFDANSLSIQGWCVPRS